MPSTGRRTIPWKLYQNTIVGGIDGIAYVSYVGLGQFGNPTAIVEAPHEVYNNNNIILVRNGRPLGRDTWVDTGAEVYDGNVYWGWSNPSSSGDTSIWRLLHRSAGLVDGENPTSSIGDATSSAPLRPRTAARTTRPDGSPRACQSTRIWLPATSP